jgi:diguanylate cyclase (GGDEF)-like protein
MAGGFPVDKVEASRHEAGEWVSRLCRGVREAVGAERVIAWLYDAERQAVSPFAADSPGIVEGVLADWTDVALEEMAVGVEVLLEARPAIIRDAHQDERLPADLAAELAMGSVRFEPLLAGRPVGMLSIEPAAGVTAAELQTLLPLVAAALGRASGAIEGDRQRAEAEFLLGLTEAAQTAGSLEELLGTLCARVAVAVSARRTTVLLSQEGALQPAASRYADGSWDRAEWEEMRRAATVLPAAEAALHSGEPVVARTPDSPLLAGSWTDTFGIQSLAAVAIGSPPRAAGVLVVDAAEPDHFSAEEVGLIVAAAGHIAPAIEQARLSDERTSHLRAATAIRRLLEEGSRAVSLEEAGETLARVTQEAIEAEQATLLMADDEDRIRHVKTVGANGEFEQVLRRDVSGLPASEFRLWRIAAREQKPIFIEDAAAARLLPEELVQALGVKSYVAFPLLGEDRALGMVLCSQVRAPRAWTNEERQLVAQLALEGSLVVENAGLRATEHQRLDELSHQAFHDSLTELPNRALFADRLGLALARTSRRRVAVAVLFLDLDGFKPINDRFGHEAGDRLLQAVAERVRACVRPEDTVARLGGDEFTVLLEDIVDVRYAIGVAERIEEALREPFPIDGHEARVTASIGIAVSSGPDTSPEELMRNSDRAMYLAKRKGRARHELFAGSATAAAVRAARMEEPAVEQAPVEEPPVEQAPVEEPTMEEDAMTAEAAAETAIIEQAEAAPLDDGYEPPRAPQPPGEEPLPAASELSEARRRRRLRFPPRG